MIVILPRFDAGHLRDRYSSSAVDAPLVSGAGGPETDGLVLGRESALNSHRLVGVLHNHWVLLDHNVVHVTTSTLKTKEIF